jgi:hypothetical protein
MALLNLNPADFQNMGEDSPEILPAGEYQMQIVDSELRATKAGDGQYLWLEFSILGPKYAGRKFWDRLNLFNKNEAAVKIARKQLANICSALNFENLPTDSVQLHNKPLKVAITHKENKQGALEARPAYMSLNGVSTAPAAAAAPAPTGAATAKPWERHKK